MRRMGAAVLLLGLFAGFAADLAHAAERGAPGARPSTLVRMVRDDGLTRVLVTLNTAFQPEGRLGGGQSALQRFNIRTAQQSVLARLAGRSHNLIATYEIFPVIALEADAATLEALRNSPEVLNVEEDIPVPPADAESNGIVRVNVPWAQGYDGTGWAVAVLDTGVQTSHPYLAGKTIAEACFSTTNAGQHSVSVCPNGLSTSGTTPGQSGAGSGVNCSIAIDGCEHGTHVAGIAVGRDYAGGPGYDGMARGASLIAIQVFSRFTTVAACGGPAPCVLSYGSDQLAALQYLYTTIRPSFGNIASANMSLGGGQNLATCDASNAALKAAIDTLRSVRIATVIAAGNDGYTNAISAPACISTAVSVGATDDADNIASFSNRAPFMSLFAPGVAIGSSVPTGAFAAFSGTSMAAPLVAGAWALVMQQNPAFTVTQALSLLQTTGKPIAITGGSVPRVRLGDAFGVPSLALNVAKAFAPNSIAYGGTSTLTVTLTNPNPVALTGTAFTDTYPGGVTNSGAPGAATTCGGTVTAAAWSASLALTGGTVPANGSCTVSVQVSAIGGGGLVNTIPIRGVTSANGGENGAATSATLTVAASNFMIQDGGFELGEPTPWAQTSSNFGTPLCTVATCGSPTKVRTGTWSAWFGGTSSAETGTLTQTKVIGAGPKVLSFYLWWASAPSATATFKVYIDGATIFSLTGATSGAYSGGFTKVNIDVSSYADGNSHALEFEQINAASSGPTNIFLDDVALTVLPANVTVTFDSNGGTVVGNQVVPYNSTASAPPAPTKTGNTFAGWYADAGLSNAFNFATPITVDITLFAKWTVNSYTVAFNSNGGTVVGSQVVPYNSLASAPPAPTKAGNTFAGWYADAGLSNAFNFATPITADITLFAKWTVNNYTVSFESNGGTVVANQVVPYNSTASTPATPTKTGNTFAGWFTDPGLTSAFSFATPITADLTLHAKWQPGTLDIDADGSYDALTDGLLVIRYLFGLSGAALTDNAIGSGATRADAEEIASCLSGLLPLLDVDADGQPDALTDGLLIVRYLFGLRGTPLVQGALGPDATRTDAADIQAYLQDLMP